MNVYARARVYVFLLACVWHYCSSY